MAHRDTNSDRMRAFASSRPASTGLAVRGNRTPFGYRAHLQLFLDSPAVQGLLRTILVQRLQRAPETYLAGADAGGRQ